MSEHDIADCPECKQHNYVLKEYDVQICLSCGHTAKMPKSKFDPESNPDIFSVIVTAIIAAMFMIAAMRAISGSA